MLTVSSSRRSLVSATAIRAPRDGEIDGLGANRDRAPQRVALPVLGQHDPRQVGMTLEGDAEEIENLTLVPVRAGHARGDAWRLAIGARLESQPGLLAQRI